MAISQRAAPDRGSAGDVMPSGTPKALRGYATGILSLDAESAASGNADVDATPRLVMQSVVSEVLKPEASRYQAREGTKPECSDS